MIDRFRLHVKGGEGGSGNGSLHRSRTDRYGKPDGGCYTNWNSEFVVIVLSDDHGIIYLILVDKQSLFIPNFTGGNGGRGGDVILQCTSAVWDFRGLQHHIVCICYMMYFGSLNILTRKCC